MTQGCDVLVVGAGPTGLLAALLLARSGLLVRLIDQRPEPTRESRAFAVQARTLELLASIGLAEPFMAQGVRAAGVCIHVGGRWRGGLDFARADADDTPFPFILMIPQSRIEAILAAACIEVGVMAERGGAATDVAQDGEGVTTRLADGTIVRSAAVIGADGAHSMVRRAGAFGWRGSSVPQRFLLADCRVDWPFTHDAFRVFLHGPLIGLFLPLDGARLSRVMATDTSADLDDEVVAASAPDMAQVQRAVAAAANVPVTLGNPVWVSRYRVHHRLADRYRNGRLFIAGDAAHIHSPAGGQGMNTGLQDAANLAWKLAAVLAGHAPNALLDTYQTERRPVGEAVVRTTGRLFDAATGQHGWRAAARDRLVSAILPVVSRSGLFQRRAFAAASQRRIGYGRSIAAAGEMAPAAGPGARVPDAVLASGSVHERIAGYRSSILMFGRRPDVPAGVIGESQAQAATFDRFGVGPGEAATLAVRPDGHVGWRANRLDPAGAAAFLDGIGVPA